jgi:hypothetical protein
MAVPRIAGRGSLVARIRSAALLVLVSALTGWAAPAVASKPEAIVLPGAISAEGIAAGGGTTFYAGDLLRGDIFRGDVRRGTAELFIDAPTGRMALAMAVDLPHGLLFVAGGFTGQAYVCDVGTGATVASYQLGAAGSSVINDVAVTRRGAWFTDSVQARLYFVPLSPAGTVGPASTSPATCSRRRPRRRSSAATGGGQRQVRYGLPAHGLPVRGRPGP